MSKVQQAVTASSEQNGAIYMGIEKILFLMNRGAAYEVLLAHLYGRLPVKILGNFEDSLLKLYEHLLDFLASALLTQKKNTIQRAFHALWTLKDFKSFSKNCQEIKKSLEIESRILESQCNRKAAEHIETILKASDCLERAITNTQSLINALREEIQEQRRREEEKENLAALHWVSSIPILDHHNNAKVGRTPDTGQWVFRKCEFSQWEQSQNPCLLWIHGIREFPNNWSSSLLF